MYLYFAGALPAGGHASPAAGNEFAGAVAAGFAGHQLPHLQQQGKNSSQMKSLGIVFLK